jgi:hypothetical protein
MCKEEATLEVIAADLDELNPDDPKGRGVLVEGKKWSAHLESEFNYVFASLVQRGIRCFLIHEGDGDPIKWVGELS